MHGKEDARELVTVSKKQKKFIDFTIFQKKNMILTMYGPDKILGFGFGENCHIKMQ